LILQGQRVDTITQLGPIFNDISLNDDGTFDVSELSKPYYHIEEARTLIKNSLFIKTPYPYTHQNNASAKHSGEPSLAIRQKTHAQHPILVRRGSRNGSKFTMIWIERNGSRPQAYPSALKYYRISIPKLLNSQH